MWTVNFQMFKLVLEKLEKPEIKVPASVGSSRKPESSRKVSTCALLTTPKPLCGSQQTVENSSRDGNTRHFTCHLRTLYTGQEATGRTGHGTDWFQIGKGVHQGCMLSPCLFNPYIQSISWETLGSKKHKLKSRLPGEISITSDMQMTPPLWQKGKRN